jgi:hypothetical protein
VRQLTAPSLQPGRRDVVKNQRADLEVAASERDLEPGLTRTHPVERTAEHDLVDYTELDQPA